MRITGVETFRVSLPLRRPHTWAGNYSPIGQRYTIVKLHVEGGHVGYGEAQTLKDWAGDFGAKYGEGPEVAEVVIERLLAPLLEGEDVRRIDDLHKKMDTFVPGYPYAKAAIDVAVHDVVGRIYGIPVYQLLGGLIRERIPIAHSLGLMPIDDAVAEAKEVIAEGVKTVKVKVGLDLERDVEIVARLREALGPGIGIRPDANKGYPSWKDALKAIRRMEKYDIWFMEQPVEGIDDMAKVAAATDVPIMADESCWSYFDAMQLIQRGAADMFSIYYTKAGGLMKARKLADVAEAGRIRCDVNGSAEMGIGNAANLHVAAACRAVVIPGTIPITSTAEIERTRIAGHKYLDDIIEAPFEYEDGHLKVPGGPGLGVEVDEAKLARYRVD